ncbi:hypothetical protein NC653_027398 [Populus alba x Populus x berolinensis]|uniref:Uncharacterized protein n=1 Tax=Populus alba x Populus x berolinensis TaxID=444605 RepID=A0AAD6M559_9ROSI|nr:hypothetical protein NC653_027398 [Populus alba x Populus x berolinensis]
MGDNLSAMKSIWREWEIQKLDSYLQRSALFLAKEFYKGSLVSGLVSTSQTAPLAFFFLFIWLKI